MEELSDGAIVWVKLSNCWWPGEVIGDEKLSDDFLSSLRKKPLAVVKFFDEDAYEYVKNPNFIFKYNCPRKTEFLRKGLEQYRAKNKHMEKFPADVMHAERMTGGDPNIVNSTDFLPQKKERYSGMFQDSAKAKDKKNKSLTPSKAMAIPVVSSVGRKTMHEIRILAQPSAASKPATSGSDGAVEKVTSPSSQTYHCHKCGFSSNRQNVIVIHTKNCRATGAAVVSSAPSTPSGATGLAKAKEADDSPKPVSDATILSADKGKTDAKLKKELLADWSEDEQDDDMDTAVDEAKNTQENSEKKKNIAKESSSSMSPQKETDNDEESAKMEQKPSDEESSTAKDSDKETTSDSPLTTSSVSSTTTAPPLVSPCTTIKYRNIPKKQKREFIEVTNDDAASVHGPVQDKAPSREDSTASSSSTTGSSDTLGNGITTLFMGTGATDRPISAKQLILNRATRCSSKSLSGDETLKADDGKLDSGKNDRGESQQNREAIKQTESIANEEVSCFDFKDDDEHEKSPQSSQFSSAAHRRSGSLADRKSAAKEAPQEDCTGAQKRRSSGRKKSVIEGALAEKEQQNSNEATVATDVRSNRKENSDSGPDRDAQLSKAIDFLLDETDVPKLPDDLKQVVAAVSEKIDCNRTLPPKERGKRIFKTRNKSSLAATTDSKESAEEPGVAKSVEAESNQSQGVEQQEKMDHEQSPDEAIPKPADVPVVSEPTAANSGVDKKAGASGTKFENSDFAAIKAKRTKYSREEDYQNPSVTSSEQGTEAVEEPEPALLERDEKPSVINPKSEVQQTPPTPGSSPNAKGRRGKQKKPTPITTPPPAVAMVESVEMKATKAVASGNETAKMDVENEASTKEVETDHQENVAKKVQRKSSENLLPDSSGSEPLQSRRRTKMKHQRDVEERVHPIEAESSRRSKRNRKETASDSAPHTISKSRVPSNIEECVVGNAVVAKETENITTAVAPAARQAEDEGMKQPESFSVAVDDEVLVEKDVKANTKQEKPPPDSGKSLKRKQNARATAEFTAKMERSLAVDGKPQEYAKPTNEGSLKAELGKDRKLKPNRHTVGSSGAVVSSTPVVMGTKPTPTDLQVAEALIHLPEAAVAAAATATSTLAILPVVSKVKEPDTGASTEKLAPSLTKDDDDLAVSSPSVTQSLQPSAVVIGAAQSSSRSGSIAMRSINPRKRHLQSMLLTEDATGEQKRAATGHKTAHVESTSVTTEPASSPVVSGGTEKQQQQQKKNTPIPERKKKESAGESEPLPPDVVAVDEDKFDIDSMPIVMGDNGLLVDDVAANEQTAVIKNVNGSGMTTVDKHQEPSVSSGPVVTTMKGGVAAKEQIVITSKGTVLTTSSPAVAVKSKLQPATKSDVKVTSAITLGTTGVRVSATAGALSATTSRRAQAEQTAPSSSSNGSPKVPVADGEQTAKEKAATALAAVPSFSVASSAAPKKMIAKKLLGDPAGTMAPASSSIVIATNVADRRYSGDEPSSSVSSSSSTEQQHTPTVIDVGGGGGNGSSDSSKKGHRVMKITPQKLQQFSRLGYVEDKGKRKVMTASGMRQFKREQLLQQQQQQHKLQPTTDNALPTQSKQASTADARKKPKHTTTKPIGSGSGVVLASSSSSRSASFGLAEAVSSGNVVVAAAADSSVQELQGGTTVSLAKQLVVTDGDGERNAMIIHETILPAATIKSTVGAPEKVPFESSDGAQLLEGSPSSSTSAASEVILGGAVESAIPSIGVVEPSSSTAASTAAGEQESQYIAVNAEHFGGPPNLFYLCSVRDEGLVPVNNELLYLDASNQLVALAAGQQHSGSGPTAEDIINQAEVIIPTGGNGADLPTVALASATGDAGTAGVNVVAAGGSDVGAVVETGSTDGTQQSFLLNTQDGQQIILDQQSLMALAAGGDTPHLLTADGQQILLQEATQEWLAALAVGQQHQQQSAALSALVTPQGTQIILAPDCIELQEQTALLPTEVIQVHPSSTIETNAILTKPPIMSTVEVPSKNGIDPSASGSTGVDQRLGRKSAPSCVPGAAGCRAAGTVGKQSPPGASILVPPAGTSVTTNLDETTLAAVIGVPCKPTNVPTSLELPITVTNPVIAKTTTTSSRLNPVLFPVGGSTTATVPSDLALPPATTVVLLAGPMSAAGTAADRAPTLSSPAASSPMHPDPSAESITEGAILPQRGATTQEDPDPDSDDDIQIPNTPDSQLDSGRQIAYESSDCDDDEVPANTPNDDSGQQRRNHYEARMMPSHGNNLMVVDDDDDDDEGSNGSEIIPLQPNVVVLDGSLLNQNLGDEVDDGDDDDDDDDGIEDDTDGDGDLEDLQQQPTVRTVHCVPTSGRNGAHGASNNDSGIDTTMAATATAASAAANNATPPNGARRTVVER
ncbi:msx2-interacting protein [Anopheles cruzii]|uniref:msx2-interacting protein n=1 Tax=Anopheles cruzii TaxID=68878 RepID=UPI0022EC4D2A|nr:msx2-interacting protein [Anopheles cruzii]